MRCRRCCCAMTVCLEVLERAAFCAGAAYRPRPGRAPYPLIRRGRGATRRGRRAAAAARALRMPVRTRWSRKRRGRHGGSPVKPPAMQPALGPPQVDMCVSRRAVLPPRPQQQFHPQVVCGDRRHVYAATCSALYGCRCIRDLLSPPWRCRPGL